MFILRSKPVKSNKCHNLIFQLLKAAIINSLFPNPISARVIVMSSLSGCCNINDSSHSLTVSTVISACIDRKVLSNQDDVRKAFKIMDTNADGTLSLDDFDDLFNSYGGAKMDTKLWDTLLMEADKNGDGVVSL